MLRIFICPKCYNYRIVSRKPDAICFDMSEQERAKYKENFIKRMKSFQEKIDTMLTEQELTKKSK